MHPGQPLQYPPHFPPTTRRKRFFLGVRGVGPDMSFLKELRASQGSRTTESMSEWGGGERQALAVAVGSIFAKYCNWLSPHFLPGDSVAVIAGGSTFGWLDETDVGDAIGAIEELVGVKMPQGFWDEAGLSTLGQLLGQLASAAGPN
jgi:hypothetical protein